MSFSGWFPRGQAAKPAADRPQRIRPAGTKCMRGRPNPPRNSRTSSPRPRLADAEGRLYS